MSIVVPRPPHFDGQPEDVYTLSGYGLLVDEPVTYVAKKMSEATGQEILTELIHHLGFADTLDETRATTSVVPVMMPYITSQFAPRRPTDRWWCRWDRPTSRCSVSTSRSPRMSCSPSSTR